ncbi:hypothetical protein E2C01_055274 [Portunus trituberculatus]|uniref:Uncharacterized protein n=1 Tax=Portunus trituberculatus TaxID=210409 RepID=A0A5B7GWD5_PORTR|nr:hypothetical protein [Portunus trituberculatus]
MRWSFLLVPTSCSPGVSTTLLLPFPSPGKPPIPKRALDREKSVHLSLSSPLSHLHFAFPDASRSCVFFPTLSFSRPRTQVALTVGVEEGLRECG